MFYSQRRTTRIVKGCTRPRNPPAAHPKLGRHESLLIRSALSRELDKANNAVPVISGPRRLLFYTEYVLLPLSDRCMTMAELALVADINGDATDYTYGEDPNEGSTWDAQRIFG